MKSDHLVIGILADVDAGKTTLSETILYKTGSIRKIGRVDHGDTVLDTDTMEKERGITIFSRQAVFGLGDKSFTLLDTPGHADFSAETERVLSVLDYAVLLISAPEGVRSHVLTLWKLLKRYRIPAFVFINKTDLPNPGISAIIRELNEKLGEGFIAEEALYREETALLNDDLTARYLETGKITESDIRCLIRDRELFPCYAGCALKDTGVDGFLEGLSAYTEKKEYAPEFGARIFKITRENGARYTHLKITGGILHVKDPVGEEKAEQIHLFSGNREKTVPEAIPGMVVAVTGPGSTSAGQGLGTETDAEMPVLVPLFSMTVLPTYDISKMQLYRNLKELEEEIPELSVDPYSGKGDVRIRLMGTVQSEVIARVMEERYRMPVSFGNNRIVYRETVTGISEGVGHFEPLRHYAEVHLKLSPGEHGSGMTFDSELSEDFLPGNYQRLILSQLEHRKHHGVLTGAVLTDVHVTLVAGKHHIKHTVGGDFREAACRALRHGLMKNRSELLEPYYAFEIRIPGEYAGRLMNDLSCRLSADFRGPLICGEESVFTGKAPVAAMQNYQADLTAFSKGYGKMSLEYAGYFSCHDPEKVIGETGYDPETDTGNPCGSVFCEHGAGYYVPWYDVERFMHLPLAAGEKTVICGGHPETAKTVCAGSAPVRREARAEGSLPSYADSEELDRIFRQTLSKNRREETKPERRIRAVLPERVSVPEPKRKYLLVDGYNIIHAWTELAGLAENDLNSARTALLDILSNYQGFAGPVLITVFDAYKVRGGKGSVEKYHNIYVVYTREAETADAYIEKTVHQMSKKYDIIVATSDGLEQMIIYGEGAMRMSAREFKNEVDYERRRLRDEGYLS